MEVLTREALMAIDDCQREEVEIPEWGFRVFVTRFSARAALEAAYESDNREVNAATLLVRALVDENGNRIFNKDDIDLLLSKSYAVIERLLKICLKLNPIFDGAEEEAEKNSEGGATGISPTALPEN